MKKILTALYIAALGTACSNETIDTNPQQANQPALTNYILKRYNVTNEPNTIIDSTNYQIENNRIVYHSGFNTATQSFYASDYIYSNSKITEIQSFNNGSLTRKQTFFYSSDDNISEYISETIDTSTQLSYYNRHTFTHTMDTIFSSWSVSENGTLYDPKVDSKIVLDFDDNRTYYESYDLITNETKLIISNYDSNSDLIDEAYYNVIDDSELLLFTNSYITNTEENHFNTINESTFSRKTFMLLYHLLGNAVNEINAKAITKNKIATFNSTWGNSFATFEITHNPIDLNERSNYNTIISGNVFSRFSQDFIFSNNP